MSPEVPVAVPSAGDPSTHRGCFVSLEGGDGAGKSTQQALLGEWLTGLGYEVVLTREPGGTALGQVLRDAVLHGEDLDPRTEALLYATDRAHHVHRVVRPALARGAVVVTDRYLDSSVAYQGAARDLGTDEIRDLSRWATQGLLPDLTVLLDLDPAVGAARRAGAPDRIEREPSEFHRRVREHFLALAAADPDRYLVLDAAPAPGQIHAAIIERLEPLLPNAAAHADGVGRLGSGGPDGVGRLRSGGSDGVGRLRSGGSDGVGRPSFGGSDGVGRLRSGGSDGVGRLRSGGPDGVGRPKSDGLTGARPAPADTPVDTPDTPVDTPVDTPDTTSSPARS